MSELSFLEDDEPHGRGIYGTPLSPAPTVRAGNPITSRLADDEHRERARGAQCLFVLGLVRMWPGSTARELAAKVPPDVEVLGPDPLYAIRRRLSDLANAGLIRQGPAKRWPEGGRLQVTWEESK